MPQSLKSSLSGGPWFRNGAAAGLLALGPTAVYLAAGRFNLPWVAAAAAVGLLFVVPGLLGVLAFLRWPAAKAMSPLWSFALNTFVLFAICAMLRMTVGITRPAFLAAWLAWTLALLLAGWRPAESIGRLREARSYGPAVLVGLATVLTGMLLMLPEQFEQCFNEDGTETYELAASLRHHVLPYRELETWDPIPGGRMGTVVVNPSLVNSYWTLGLLTLIDHRETAVRLPFWIWSLGGMLVAFRLVRRSGPGAGSALPLAALMFLAAVNFTFYVGYDRYMSDIGNPGVTDALFTMLLLLSYDGIARGCGWAWAVSILMASLVLYAGPVMFVLSVLAMLVWRPLPPVQTVRWALLAGGLLTVAAGLYATWGWCDGSIRYWLDTLDQEYVNHYMADISRWLSTPLFLGYFALGAGGLAAVGIVTAFRRDPWQRTVATITLLYLAIVLGSGFKNLHWLAPLWPVPLILLLRRNDAGAGTVANLPDSRQVGNLPYNVGNLSRRTREWCLPVIATASILVCIAISWPKNRATFTLNRELGAMTTILTDDPLAAATWARVRLTLQDDRDRRMGWTCDAWTWVTYSEMTARPNSLRPLVLTDGKSPGPGYRMLASRPVEGTATIARLYCCDREVEAWLKRSTSPGPRDRYPWIYGPLASGVCSPHENRVEDVQRMGWR